ncbi:MAG: cytochrome P450 [Chloroflexota bacterium]
MSNPSLPNIADPAVWQTAVPHETFTWLRANEPIAWWDHPDGQKGFWVVSRWQDVVDFSRDTDTFSSRAGVVNLDDLAPDQLEARRTFLEEDPPRHTAIRALVDPDFSPRAVRAWETLFRQTTQLVLDETLQQTEFDFVEQIAKTLPIRILCKILGVPEQYTDNLVLWGNQMLGASDPDYHDPELATYTPESLRKLPFGHPAALRAFDLAETMAQTRRNTPVDDVTSRLLLGDVEGHPLSDEEFKATWLMIVIAGNETTRHALSNGLLAFINSPDQWERLRRNPELAGTAAEEILRWSTPINWHRRQVVNAYTRHGVTLQPGDKLILAFTSANRDESVFASPFSFDIARKPNAHVSFGRGGPHHCLGAFLARMEIRLVLEALLARCQHFELAGPVRRLRSNHFNGIKSLPIKVIH